jgi:predicted DsbA family dithiol-disulfide isomerase
MELTLLTVPGCPHAAEFEQRRSLALADHPAAVVHRQVVADEREAAQVGMRGSPTLLIDGVDRLAAPGQGPSLSCRLYPDGAGGLAGAPPVEALRQAMAEAAGHA